MGTRGEILQDGLREPGFGILAAGAPSWVFERAAPEPFAPPSPGALDYLVTCLERGVDSEARIEDARTSLGVALACYESARSGRPVDLKA